MIQKLGFNLVEMGLFMMLFVMKNEYNITMTLIVQKHALYQMILEWVEEAVDKA